MKTMKMMLAALAVSLFAAPAFSEVPVDVQKKVRELDGVQKVRKNKSDKAKAKAAKSDDDRDAGTRGGADAAQGGRAEKQKPRAERGEAKMNTGAEKVEHGKDDRLTEAKRPARPEHAGGRPSPVDEGSDIATKRSPNAAKGLDRLGKEERKHLRNLARIGRLADIAAQHQNAALAARIETLREKETLRYARALNKIDSPDMGE